MTFVTDRALDQDITWWAVSPDGYGGDAFAAPVLIQGRWQDRQELYIGQVDRSEHISKAMVFVDRDIAVGDYLCQGDQTAHSDPTVLGGAYKSQRFDSITDLRNANTLRRATL
jgi:hypothetical protein